MRKIITLLFLLSALAARAQMWNGTDTLYGNEWIDFSKTYYKIKVAEDGVYRVSMAALSAAGLGNTPLTQFRLYAFGEEQYLYLSTQGTAGPSDYLEFFGEKNRDRLDRYLFENPDKDLLNPRYSLFNDTAVYYLYVETNSQGLRYALENNDLSNLPPAEPWCWFTTEQVLKSGHFKKEIAKDITNSWFDGNGFSSNESTLSAISLSPSKLVAAGPDASLSLRYACNLNDHRQQVLINDSLFADTSFYNYRAMQYEFPVKSNWLTAVTTVKVKSALSGNADRNSVTLVTLRYPRAFDFDNAVFAEFTLEGAENGKYLEIQGFNSGSGAPLLYDLNNKRRLMTTIEGGIIKARLGAGTAQRRIILVSENAVKVTGQLPGHQFHNYEPEQADYLIISNPALYHDPAAGGADHVADYAAYRASAQGGGHKVSVADINELYEQFAYGLRFHPMAIRNFLHYADKKWPGLEHVFLIGKGLDYRDFRTSAQQSALVDSVFFLPTFGTPASDMPFVMRGSRLNTPVAAIGRLAVTQPGEIKAYLDKVVEHEQSLQNAGQTIAEKAWMKRVLHNSGGQPGETQTIREHTTEMAQVLSNNRFGADVHPFYKTSNDPIQLSSYEQILDLVNDGVSIWTIFGHSSANAVDFDIGSPGSYNNAGRYPLMLIMGCFSGICSAPQQKGIGEQFVLSPKRGVIAYIASVNYSFVDGLHEYGVKYYDLLGGTEYGKSIGQVYLKTVEAMDNTTNERLIAVLHQNLLQGDPAVKVHMHAGPDYVIDNQSVQFEPNPIGLEQGTFNLNFDVVNIGENPGGNLTLNVDQRLPDNTTILPRKRDTIVAPPFRRTMHYTLPVNGSKVGFNRFFMRLDEGNQIAEQPLAAENNNDLVDGTGAKGTDVYFYSDDVFPVYPTDFGILSSAKVKLKASTLNVNAAPLRYLFEFDTLETFDSPYKIHGEVIARGGLLEWAPPVDLADSTVYYWRVARDSLVNGQVVWRQRSFIRLAFSGAGGGWNQSHYGQYKADLPANLQLVDSTRTLEFVDNACFINVKLAYRDLGLYPGIQNNVYQGFYGDYGFNVLNVPKGVVLMVLDPRTGRTVIDPANGPFNPMVNQTSLFYWFNTEDSLKRIGLMQFIENEVPNGYYVALLAFNRADDGLGYAPQHWAKDSITYGKNLFQLFEQQGAQDVRKLTTFTTAPHPYGLIFRKNDPGFPAIDTFLVSPDSTIEIRGNFKAKWTLGYLESTVIGPVKSWKSLHWRRNPFDDSSDQATLSLLAVREGLPDSLLYTFGNQVDTTLDFISAAEYPLLKLRYDVIDTLIRSVSQLRYARILYEGIPEGALHPAAYFTFQSDTLEQGDEMRAGVAFANVSDLPMDSMLVKFRIENETGTGADTLRTFRNLPAGDTLHASFSTTTRHMSGKMRLLVDVNPNNAQPELYHFNNVLVRDFYVGRDNRNPLLDVTFDGIHILDNDLVSPKPEITITLKDDNRFLAMTDTATFKLSLLRPDGINETIAFSDPNLMFFPADATNLPKKNLARLEWRPTFTLDGDYRLLVKGRDASGNESAQLDYSITFKVITKSSISNILNYPNPFSTSTCFVYTLTGAETPAHFKVQIMTVSGRVVREITEAEFGPLRAGTHQSDYCWNGKDEYGDQLANGVYLYRIVAKKADGSDFEFFENTGIDNYFKHGFGKMVIMR